MTEKTFGEAHTPGNILQDADERMTKSMDFLMRDLGSVRTGRATPGLVESLTVDYYGAPTPLNQLATISAPEAQLVLIQPWDKQALQEIEKAILKSSLGLNPSNDGALIRLPIPPLSQERRQELVRSLAKTVEESKVAVRNIRRDAQDKLRSLERSKGISQDESQRALVELQKTTDTHIAEMDRRWQSKSEDLMKV